MINWRVLFEGAVNNAGRVLRREPKALATVGEHIPLPPSNNFYTHTSALPTLPASVPAASTTSTLEAAGGSVFEQSTQKLEREAERWLRTGSAVDGQGRLPNIPLSKEEAILRGVANAELERARILHPNASEEIVQGVAEQQIYLSGQNGFLRTNHEKMISTIIEGTPLTNMPDWQKPTFEALAKRLYGGNATTEQLENLAETLAQKYGEALKPKQLGLEFNTTPNAPQKLFEEVGDNYVRLLDQYRNPQLK